MIIQCPIFVLIFHMYRMPSSDIDVLQNVYVKQKNRRPTVVPGQVLELRGCFTLSLSIAKSRDEN